MSDQPTPPEATEAPAPKKRARRTKAAPVAASTIGAPAGNEPEAREAAAPVAPIVQEASVKVRVLENGLRIAGGVAAKGRVLNVKESQAATLERLGKVQIVGV